MCMYFICRYFMEPRRQRTMLSVLYIWSVLHFPSPSYRQV